MRAVEENNQLVAIAACHSTARWTFFPQLGLWLQLAAGLLERTSLPTKAEHRVESSSMDSCVMSGIINHCRTCFFCVNSQMLSNQFFISDFKGSMNISNIQCVK